MANTQVHRTTLALTGLRVVVAGLLFIHGSSRLLTNGIPGFGEFFVGHHLPAAGAWVVTGLEIVATPVLAFGLWVRLLALYFAAELIAGVILVHAQYGWFVVGGGTNGMEYSVLLISVLVAVAFSPPASTHARDDR